MRNTADKQPNELIFRCKLVVGKDKHGNSELRDMGMAYFSRSRYRDQNGVWDGLWWDLVTLDPETDERVILAKKVAHMDIPRVRWNYMISPAIVRPRKDGKTDVVMNIRRNHRWDRVSVNPVTEEE